MPEPGSNEEHVQLREIQEATNAVNAALGEMRSELISPGYITQDSGRLLRKAVRGLHELVFYKEASDEVSD